MRRDEVIKDFKAGSAETACFRGTLQMILVNADVVTYWFFAAKRTVARDKIQYKYADRC